jgi:hypothetical protein
MIERWQFSEWSSIMRRPETFDRDFFDRVQEEFQGRRGNV